jgi:hypothetical protein
LSATCASSSFTIAAGTWAPHVIHRILSFFKKRDAPEPLHVQIFNLINANTVLTESYTLGTSITPYVASGPGGQPSVIANPRMLRLSLQFKF